MDKEEECVKKYLKFIIILLIIIILSTVVYLAVDKSKTKEETQSASEGIVQLCGFDVLDITQMTVVNTSGTYDFKFEDNIWSWSDEENAPFDCSTISLSQLADSLSNLTSTKIISENSDDISKYGFNNSLVISCHTSDGKDYSVEIGSKNPTGDSYYVKKVNENTVYTISSEDGDRLNVQKDALKNNYLLDVFISEVTKISLERQGELVFDVQKDEGGVWQIINPVSEVATDITKISSYSDLLVRANAIAFIEENPSDLSKYGLDNPSYTLDVSTNEKDVHVIFGNECEDIAGGIYTMIETAKLKEVTVFYKSNLGFLDAETKDVLSPLVYGFNTKKVADVDISIEGQSVNLSMDSESDKYSFNGVDITDDERISLYTEFFQSFNAMEISGTDISAEIDTSQTPSLEINYTMEDGSEVISSYYTNENSDCYYLVKNGKYTGITVSSDAVTAIKAAYAGILNRVSEEASSELTETETVTEAE